MVGERPATGTEDVEKKLRLIDTETPGPKSKGRDAESTVTIEDAKLGARVDEVNPKHGHFLLGNPSKNATSKARK